MNTLPKWGPSHQHSKTGERNAQRTAVLLLVAFVALITLPDWVGTLVVIAAVVVTIARFAYPRLNATSSATSELASAADPLAAVLEQSRACGGGVYLGLNSDRGWVCAPAEHGVLLIGPPRSGKTSGVMVPSLLAHSGPVVCASTKPDVLSATSRARSGVGHVWEFDPTGERQLLGPGAQLRWSPVRSAKTWDGALLMARAMVTGSHVGAGTTDSTHWAKRASALLAPMLHAAALSAQGIEVVASWVLRHDLDAPMVVLERARAQLPAGVLAGLQNTEARERSSILSAAADALEAYSSTGALTAAREPNFDASAFVHSRETIYIHAPAEQQALAAPLVCGLLSEIRAATYTAHRNGTLGSRLLFALDEAANIAPLADLPQIASEGGSQGLQFLACFQDLSQARARWGQGADGFLTLFGTKLILPGVADQRTLESVSVALGEYDRQMVATGTTRAGGVFDPGPAGFPRKQTSKTVSTQRQRVLSPGEIAGIPAGEGLHLEGVAWQLLTLTPAHRSEPWHTLTQSAAGR
jgi:type IV secretory pathway TraG/TraD family ATPase VirD4